MKVSKLIFLLALCISLLSCEQEVLPDSFTHKYQQTKCSDPWGNDRDANAFTQAVVNYLQQKLINPINTETEVTTGASCEACHCVTGTSILIKLSEEDGQKLMGLNEGWEAL